MRLIRGKRKTGGRTTRPRRGVDEAPDRVDLDGLEDFDLPETGMAHPGKDVWTPPTPELSEAANPRKRRRVWDLDEMGGDTVAEPVDAPVPEIDVAALGLAEPEISDDDIALAREQVARFRDAGALQDTPAAAGTERAKTRVLGFRGGEIAAQDPMAGESVGTSARGPDMPVGWLIVTEGPGRGASYTLTAGVSNLGRGADQTVALDFGDTSISRQTHASVAYDPETNRFFLGHGGKSNIVRLNGRPVLSTEDLSDGDTIRLGETTLRFIALCGDAFTWVTPAAGGADVAAE